MFIFQVELFVLDEIGASLAPTVHYHLTFRKNLPGKVSSFQLDLMGIPEIIPNTQWPVLIRQ